MYWNLDSHESCLYSAQPYWARFSRGTRTSLNYVFLLSEELQQRTHTCSQAIFRTEQIGQAFLDQYTIAWSFKMTLILEVQ